jgi:dTDP-glucose 4,6-dehydratase
MIDDRDLEHILEHTRARWEGLRGEQIFITGGTGFVGSWLVASFARANRELRLGARAVVLTRDLAAARTRMAQLGVDSAVDLQQGDGTDFAFPPGRFAFVIHAATQRSFAPRAGQPLGIIEADTITTRRVLEFARSARTARMLFTSTGAVYGPQPAGLQRVDEEFGGAPLPTDVDAAYGHSKRMSEVMCAMYARSCGITISIARLFASFGPLLPLDEGYAIGNFIGDALARRAIRIDGDGTPIRSYLYAADLAIWLWTMLFAGRSGCAYNTGGTEALTIAELARFVALETGAHLPIEIAQAALPHVMASRYVPDTTRAQRELGLRALIPIGEGIRRSLSWHRDRSIRATRDFCQR